MADYPEGAITTLEEFKALAGQRVFIAPSMYDHAKGYGIKSPIVTSLVFSGETFTDASGMNLVIKDSPTFWTKGGRVFWTRMSDPVIIPFEQNFDGYIFTKYWMAYGHLARVLQQRKKQNGNP